MPWWLAVVGDVTATRQRPARCEVGGGSGPLTHMIDGARIMRPAPPRPPRCRSQITAVDRLRYHGGGNRTTKTDGRTQTNRQKQTDSRRLGAEGEEMAMFMNRQSGRTTDQQADGTTNRHDNR